MSYPPRLHSYVTPDHNSRSTYRMKTILILMALTLASCAGKLSSHKDGRYYSITEQQAKSIITKAMASRVSGDRILPSSDPLITSGYHRAIGGLDTHTFWLEAFPHASGFGFEVTHRGTIFLGPHYAKQLYEDANRRAEAVESN